METAEQKASNTHCNTPPPPFPFPVQAVSLFYAALSQATLVYFQNTVSVLFKGQQSETMTVIYISEKMFDASRYNYWSNGPVYGNFHWSTGHFTGHRPVDQWEF